MMDEESAESGERPTPPEILGRREESEAAFWRLKRASDKWREDRVKRVLAQEGEGLLTTLGRVIYISICVLFDGVVMMQIPVSMGKTSAAWAIYVILLMVAVKYQREFYDRWFSLDISQIDFDRPQ